MLTLLPILFNIILEVPDRVIRQETDRKCIWSRKEDIILSVFRIQDTTYRNPEVSTKKLLELINRVSKVAKYKINYFAKLQNTK